MTKESLVRNAAKELNKVMGLTPPIDIKADTDDILAVIKKEVLRIGTGKPPLITPEDEFTPEVQELLDELIANGEEEKTEPVEEKKETKKKKETPESVGKIHKKNIADKPIQVGEPEKKATKPAPKKEEKEEKKEAAPKKKQERKMESNEDLAVRLLKEKATDEEITEAFRAAYAEKEKNVTDKFLEKRVKIYMDIAKKKTAKK